VPPASGSCSGFGSTRTFITAPGYGERPYIGLRPDG
jgi:hypothetical protein